MQGIKEDRLCVTSTFNLIVGCLMQLNTSMEKTGKPFFQTTPFNLYLWGRMRLVNKETLSGPDSYLRAVQWVKEFNNKHGDKFASVKQVQINQRMEMFACVVDPFHRRPHIVYCNRREILLLWMQHPHWTCRTQNWSDL